MVVKLEEWEYLGKIKRVKYKNFLIIINNGWKLCNKL